MDDRDFVLPENGPDLFARHPEVVATFIRGFLYRHHRELSTEDIHDMVMDAWVHLLSKPSHGRNHNTPSVHTEVDRVAMFDPVKMRGATSRHFFAYIKIILYNWYYTQYGSDAYDHGTVSIASGDEEELGVTERLLNEQFAVRRRQKSVIQHVMLSEFLAYLLKRDPLVYYFVCVFLSRAADAC